MTQEEQSITLHLEFERRTAHPERVFAAMKGLIESLQSADALLVKGLHLESELRPAFILEDIKAGSLKTKLAQILYKIADSVPEETLASGDYKKGIGAFLVKGKHWLANYLASKDSLPTSAELHTLGEELQRIATEEAPTLAQVFVPPTPSELLVVFQKMTIATSGLIDGDSATYQSAYGEVRLQQKLSISDSEIKEILTREKTTNTNTIILQVRRPDFLGGAQWEFKHLDQSLRAKIRDQTWLDKFHERQEVVLPGDSLRVEMTTTVAYGPDWKELDHDHTINRVIEVLRAPSSSEPRIL
jgi:hypothetical protein